MAVVGQGGVGVDEAVAIGPDAEHAGGGDPADVDRHGGCGQVDRGGGGAVEDAGEAAFAEQGEGGDEVVDAAAVLASGAGAGGGVQLGWPGFDEGEHVGDGGVHCGV